MPFIGLVIPALNEEQALAGVLAELPAGFYSQVLVADNGSTDRTAQVATAAGATVVLESRRGYGSACLAALDRLDPRTEIVVFMDADGSDVAGEAAALVEPITADRADLVIGSRVLGRAERGAIQPHQRFGNWLATSLLRLLYGFHYTDLGPFRAIRAASLRQLDMQDRNFGWTVEMQAKALRHGLRVMEVAVTYRRRRAGKSKISGNLLASLRAGQVILTTIWRLRRG